MNRYGIMGLILGSYAAMITFELKPRMMRKILLLLILCLGLNTAFAQDTIPPKITLKGGTSAVLGVLNKWVDPGVTITDNVDTTFTVDTLGGTFYSTFPNGYADDLGAYTIYYKVKDKAGNKDSVVRTVIVEDTIPPVMTFPRRLHCTVHTVGSPIILDDSGSSTHDNFSKNSDLKITIEGCIDSFPGIYKYRYVADDKSGNLSKSPWLYLIVKASGDNSPCVLTDSLKDTCARLVSGIRPPQKENEIKIYPNPARDAFYIKPIGKGGVTVKVVDLSGKIRFEKEYTSAIDCKVNTTNLPNGVYMVEVMQDGKIYLGKLVVMH